MMIVTQYPLEQRYQPRPLVVLLMLVVFGPGSGIVCPSVSSVTVADHGRTTGRPDNRTTGMQVDIGQFWAEHDIVPVLIDRAPLVFAKVVYRAKQLVDAGKELQPVEVREEPKVEWCADPTALYTLLMLDPDSPSRMEPWNREFAHWLVGNIPGRHVEQGDTLYQYIPVFPRAGSGCHRYIFLIFRQQCWNDYAAVERVSSKNRTPRVRFSTRDFAYRYSLGSPVAGNFFLAQYDDYVPVLLSRYPDSNDF